MWGWVTSIEVIMIMKFDMICNKVFDVESDTFGNPVLDTVVLYATFWSMNSSVWAVWAAQAARKKNGFDLF